MTVKTAIPLLQVLKEMKGYQRQIILSHLDNKSLELICDGVGCVFKKHPQQIDSRVRKKVFGVARQNRKKLQLLMSGRQKNLSSKKRALIQLGGNPLALILSTAIPLLMNLFRK